MDTANLYFVVYQLSSAVLRHYFFYRDWSVLNKAIEISKNFQKSNLNAPCYIAYNYFKC